MNTYKRTTINFGKINYNNTGRRYPVSVTLELRKQKRATDGAEYTEFTACGSIGARSGGQNLDEIKKFLGENKTFARIYAWWKAYHLNGCHAGTREQEVCIADNAEEMKAIKDELEAKRPYYWSYISHYDCACELLKRHGLYEVEHEGKPYKYGHAWLVETIPAETLAEMETFIDTQNEAQQARE